MQTKPTLTFDCSTPTGRPSGETTYSFYGVYAACRDAAWQCQLDFGVRSLPVKMVGIARLAGIRILKNSSVGELRPGELGVSIFDGTNWTIVYDDRMDSRRARYVIAHEFGHIFLGHEYKYADRRFSFSQRKLKCEREADMFAMRLLAPACILHELKIIDAAKIAELCEMPDDLAFQRAQRMKTLEERGRFYQSALERKVADSFAVWLENAAPPSSQ